MDWAVLMQMIMAIMTIIMEFLGGGAFSRVMQPDQEVVYRLAHNQFSCSQVYWTEFGKVVNSEFRGTVALNCQVYGLNGGGLSALKNHMAKQVKTVSTGNISQVTDGGLNGENFDSVYEIGKDDTVYAVHGNTWIGSAGNSQLVSRFTSTSLPKEGNMKYLSSIKDEVEVQTTDRSGWYHVRMQYRAVITRPWFVSETAFRDSLIQRFEADMLRRKDRVINDIADHL